MGTAEVESALVAHHDVAEAAVVGTPHEIKGQGIYAYVTLNIGVDETDALKKELSPMGPERNWPHRIARLVAMGTGITENPFRQNHAPHFAQNCRK